MLDSSNAGGSTVNERVEPRATELMTADVVTIPGDATVRELAELLVRNEISGTVVVDPTGRPVGVVSAVDIVRATAGGEDVVGTAGIEVDFYGCDDETWDESDFPDLPDGGRALLVRDIMTPAIYAVGESAPLSEIARQMVDNHLHRLLVLREERLVGIVSSTDVLRRVARPST